MSNQIINRRVNVTMMKYVKLSIVLLLSLIVFIGCSANDDTEDKEKDPGTEEEVTDVSDDKDPIEVKEDKSDEKQDETADKKEEKKADVKVDNKSDETAEEAYKRVLEEYSLKIKKATPVLVEEYNNESKSNTDGVEGLAELSNDKIMKLAEINAEGTEEMADIMLKKGSGAYNVYEDWAGKLMDVYLVESVKITEAYMGTSTQ